MNDIYHKRWTADEVRILTAWYMDGRSYASIADRLGRTVEAVKNQALRRRLPMRKKREARKDSGMRSRLDCMPNPFRWMNK